MKNHLWQVIGIIAVVAIGGSIVYSNSVSNKANEGVTFESHIKGNEAASVVLTEYSDFECPACGQFYGVINQMFKEFPTEVKLEYKHFPLSSIHKHAISAAKAAEAAGQQGKFFPMHDKLFENQKVWSKSATPHVYYEKYAEEIGLDMKLFKTHMKSSAITDKIASEFKEARDLGLNGTPSFFLNGEHMQFQTYQDFIDQISVAIEATKTDVSDTQGEEGAGNAAETTFGF